MKKNFEEGKTINFHIGIINIFSSYYEKGIGWFRIFGIGIHWKDISRHKMYFSERNGYVKYLKIGSWIFKLLIK